MPKKTPEPIGALEAITEDPMRIVTEDDGEVPALPAGVRVDGLIAEAERAEKQAFLDMCAVQLFVAGWAHEGIYARAERLWKLRETYIGGKK